MLLLQHSYKLHKLMDPLHAVNIISSCMLFSMTFIFHREEKDNVTKVTESCETATTVEISHTSPPLRKVNCINKRIELNRWHWKSSYWLMCNCISSLVFCLNFTWLIWLLFSPSYLFRLSTAAWLCYSMIFVTDGLAYLSQGVFVHVVLLHNVLQSKVDLLLEFLDFAGLHQPRTIWKGHWKRRPLFILHAQLVSWR